VSPKLGRKSKLTQSPLKPEAHAVPLCQRQGVHPSKSRRPIAVELDRRPGSSSNFPRACKNVNLHPPFLIPCVILIIVTTGMILRTQVLSVMLAMASAQIITLNLVFR